MKIKLIKQPDDTACGPSCVFMATQYFNLPHSFKEIAEKTQYIEKDGLSNDDIVSTLSSLGLHITEKNSSSWSDLMELNQKENVIIVSWMKLGYLGHFSVVEEVTENHIVLADPEEENFITIEKIIFLRLWMDYDDMWFPQVNTDIQLRWMCVITKK